MTRRNLRHDKLRVRTPEGIYRTLGPCIHAAQLDLPEMDSRANDAWSSMLGRCGPIDQGDVAGLTSHPGHLPDQFEPVVKRWLAGLGVSRESLETLDMSPLACRGAAFHSDSHSFSENAFAVVWLSQDTGLDLLFPQLDRRIPLAYGTVIFFDCAQIHGVVRRGSNEFAKEDFSDSEPTGCFVSIDLPILRPSVGRPLGAKRTSSRQVRSDGVKHVLGWEEGFSDLVCPTTARWTGRARAGGRVA